MNLNYAHANMSDPKNDPTNDSDRAIERLDVEDEDQRQKRMRTCFPSHAHLQTCNPVSLPGGVFMQLDSKVVPKPQGVAGNLAFDFGERKTFMVEPNSERKWTVPVVLSPEWTLD